MRCNNIRADIDTFKGKWPYVLRGQHILRSKQVTVQKDGSNARIKA